MGHKNPQKSWRSSSPFRPAETRKNPIPSVKRSEKKTQNKLILKMPPGKGLWHTFARFSCTSLRNDHVGWHALFEFWMGRVLEVSWGSWLFLDVHPWRRFLFSIANERFKLVIAASFVSFGSIYPPKFSSSPLKIHHPNMESIFLTTIFQGRAVKLRGCNSMSPTCTAATCTDLLVEGESR